MTIRGLQGTATLARGPVVDTLNRPLRDLRLSVTDRCNFRCVYCMPKALFGRDYAFLDRDELLSFDELARIARIAVANGVEKIRLTGGEPLLRTGLDELVRTLAALRTPHGRAVDLALTTNGSALAARASALKSAGLGRVTVSLDSLDDATFQAMNDIRFPVARVLKGIDAAEAAGLGPVKINMVVKRGQNDGDVLDMARYFRGTSHVLRFIEFMDVGSSNGWNMGQVVPSGEIISRIDSEFPLEAVAPTYQGETSARWRYRDGAGEIGVISSVTQPFCQTCTRARVSADGTVFTCLFATGGHDLRALMRGGCDDEELARAMALLWTERTDRYSLDRSASTTGLTATGLSATGARKIEMSYIGG